MRTKILFLCLVFYLFCTPVIACQFILDFCQALNNCGTLVEVELVEINTNTSNEEISIVYKIIEFVTNPNELEFNFITWRSCKDSPCDASGKEPLLGKKFLLVLCESVKSNTKVHASYSNDICSNNVLTVVNDEVSYYSKINQKIEVYDLGDFKEDISDICNFLTLENGALDFFGTLSSGSVFIRNNGSFTLKYQVFDATGRLVEQHLLTSMEETIQDFHAYPRGIYFFKFSNGFETLTKKLVRT